MNTSFGDTERTLAAYAESLARHLDDLERFLELAERQTMAARVADADELAAVTGERDVAMRALLETARALAPARAVVESLGTPWTEHPAWGLAATCRQRIGELVRAILAQDEVTRTAILESDERRQQDRREIEAGNATLHAYRRMVSPTSRPASLVDHRG